MGSNKFILQEQVKKQDPLHSALDSFYSDIAAIETTNSNDVLPALPTEDTKPPETPVLETNHENPKKKSKKVSRKKSLIFSFVVLVEDGHQSWDIPWKAYEKSYEIIVIYRTC